MRRAPSTLFATGALVLATYGAVAQTLPPPPDLAPTPMQPPAVIPPSTTPAPSASKLRSFELKEVRFPATRAVSAADLQAVAAPYIGRQVTGSDLDALGKALQQLYEDRGFGLAGIGFVSQDVSKGILNVAIIEPKLGRINVVAGETGPVSEARIRGLVAHVGLRTGEPLSIARLDRAMFALNDLPGVAAKATLTPTGDEGVFDLSVETEPRRRFEAAADLDNHGNRSIGVWRLGGLARWNNPFRIGDNLDLRVLSSVGSGLTFGRLSYEAPIGYTPVRANLGFSRVGYTLGGTFSPLDANGIAEVWDASVSYPLIRSRGRNLVVRAGVEDKALHDRFDALELLTDKRVRNLLVSASFEGNDGFGGGGFTGAAVQAQLGRLGIDTTQARQDDAALGDLATQGRFGKVSLQLSRLQALAPKFSLFGGLSAQWASKNLDGAEKFTLGGARAVRAYPGAESPSDQGAVINTELRYFVNPRWTVFALWDWGRGRLRKRPADETDNVRTLQGSGFGLHFSDPQLFTLRASLAWRGDEKPQSDTGNDSPRLYLQLQRPF